MRTKEEILKRIDWCNKALDDVENQNEIMQTKLWNAIDTLNWVLSGKEQ